MRCAWPINCATFAVMFLGDLWLAVGAGAQGEINIDVVPRIGHSDAVYSVAFSVSGAQVITGSVDKTLRLWDAKSGRLIRVFQGHSGKVLAVATSPNGSHVLSGSEDKTLKLWDLANGRLLRTFEGHLDAVFSVAFSPDGQRAISGSDDDTLKLWEVSTGRLLQTLKHSYRVNSGVFSPDGRRVVSGSDDGAVKLWDAQTGRLLRTLEGHSDSVLAVAFSPDSRRILSGGQDQKLWDAQTGRLLRTLVERSTWISSVSFSPDGRRVLTGDHAGMLKILDFSSGALVTTVQVNLYSVLAVAFSRDGKRLVSASGDRTAKLWDVTGNHIRTFDASSAVVHSVAFSPDGKHVLAGSNDKTFKLWDVRNGQLLRTLQADSVVRSLAFSPDGRQVLSGGYDKTLTLWELANGKLLRIFEGHSDSVDAVAFSSNGRHVLSGGGSEGGDSALRLWDVSSGRLLQKFVGHTHGITSVAFAPDGLQVISGSHDKTLKMWDPGSGQLLRTFEGHSQSVLSVAYSPDGLQVVSGSVDKTIKLWDARSGQLLTTFEGQTGWIQSVTFSPDGRLIVSGSDDSTVRIWNPELPQAVATLFATADGEWVAITSDGFFNASGKAADNILTVVRGFEATTIGQVHQSLFNPDLVREALAFDPEGEVRHSAKLINLQKVLDSGPAPVVTITSHAEASESVVDLVMLQAKIVDGGKGIGRIEWRVNGITAAVAPGSGGKELLTQQIALDAGDNIIEVVAYNASDLLASLPARTTIKFTGPADQAKPSLYILAIGINAYVDRGWVGPDGDDSVFEALALAKKDAEAFAEHMEKAGTSRYGKVRVVKALDEQATRANLSKLVDQIAGEIHPRDTFILFAAAHGKSDKQGRFYLIPQDYDGGADPNALAQRAIAQDELQDWLANRIKAKKAVVFLDTCESGALIAGHKRSRTELTSEAGIGRLHEATGRPVLTAAALGQDALEITRLGHGVFTSALIDALYRGDRNGDGLIAVSELASHVQDLVPKLAAGGEALTTFVPRGTAGGQQSARFGSRGEDFVLGRRLP